MKASIEIDGKLFNVDFAKPIDISMRLSPDPENASAWYVDPVSIEPVRTENFVGDVNEGGSVNFNDINFNPHGNGTHTECVGHISEDHESINEHLKKFMFSARVVSVEPEQIGQDKVITLDQMKMLINERAQAVVIRTLPNTVGKKKRQYSNSNPPYIEKEAMTYLLSLGIDHLLVDLPSVDRENDGGVLAAHHEFWEHPRNTQKHRTITEFVFVPDEIEDGMYLLNIQIAPFENDASPSKPILYALSES